MTISRLPRILAFDYFRNAILPFFEFAAATALIFGVIVGVVR